MPLLGRLPPSPEVLCELTRTPNPYRSGGGISVLGVLGGVLGSSPSQGAPRRLALTSLCRPCRNIWPLSLRATRGRSLVANPGQIRSDRQLPSAVNHWHQLGPFPSHGDTDL